MSIPKAFRVYSTCLASVLLCQTLLANTDIVDGNLDTQEGLQSATPTDSIDELNSGNGGESAPVVEEGEADFPGANVPVSSNTNHSATETIQPVLSDAETLMNQIATPDKQTVPSNALPAVAPVAPSSPVIEPVLNASPTTMPAAAIAEPIAATMHKAPTLLPPNEFAGAPPIPGSARLMADGEAPEEYVVEPGDTLYDIVDQLLDEAAYWPKLWSLNPEIKNPHFIFPGMRLRFYPGDDETPPYLQVVSEDEIIPVDKGDLEEAQLVAEEVQIDREEAQPHQVDVIGPEQVEDPPELADLILTGGGFYRGGNVMVQVPGFIYREVREPLAIVIGGRTGEVSLGPDQKALLAAAAGVSAGTLYTLLRPGEEIKDPRSGDFIGYKYYFVANLRIERSVGEERFIGKIENSRLTARPNDIVVNFVSTNRSVDVSESIGAVSAASAQVLGFQYASQEIGSQGDYAFVSSGGGVSPGMFLPIYSSPGSLMASGAGDDLPEDYQRIGTMRIIDVTDAGAVGYVVHSSQELRVGDRTGG